MTPAKAQSIQDKALRRGNWIMWFVTMECGRAVATAKQADRSGGTTLGQLVADTLNELRAMIPTGLTRREATAMMPPDVIETWDKAP